jgi:DNA-directed RNA polymerase subunit M/transcription elongation factor TFIIS
MATPKELAFAKSPLSGKFRFKFRTLNNCLLVAAIFIPLVWFFAQFWWCWYADIVLIAILYYLYFFIWDKRAIKICCPECLKYIRSNTPWVCGVCGAKNLKVDEFPFVHRCGNENCGAEPKAYQCHHCDALIFLTEDEDKRNYAVCVNIPAPVEKDEIGEKIFQQREQKRDLVHEIEITELQGTLKEAKNKIDPPKEKTLREILEQELERRIDRNIGAYELGERKRAVVAEKFKNDPEALKRANLTINEFQTDHS